MSSICFICSTLSHRSQTSTVSAAGQLRPSQPANHTQGSSPRHLLTLQHRQSNFAKQSGRQQRRWASRTSASVGSSTLSRVETLTHATGTMWSHKFGTGPKIAMATAGPAQSLRCAGPRDERPLPPMSAGGVCRPETLQHK